MNHPQFDTSDHIAAFISGIVSLLSMIFGWIGLIGAEDFLVIGGTCISIFTGLIAARYYWFAGQEKKENIMKKRQQLDEKSEEE